MVGHLLRYDGIILMCIKGIDSFPNVVQNKMFSNFNG